MVMYSGPIMHAMFKGSIGTEQWSVGYWWEQDVGTVDPTPTQANTWAANLLSAFNSIIWTNGSGGIQQMNSSDTNLSGCQMNYYNGGILRIQGNATQSPVAGTGTADPHPAYVALVVSLLTDLPGRRHRGRCYQPATAIPISGATSQVSTLGFTANNATQWALMLTNGANLPPAQPGLAGAPVILSQVAGSLAIVTSVRVDSLPDTQHGRSRRLVALQRSVHSVP